MWRNAHTQSVRGTPVAVSPPPLCPHLIDHRENARAVHAGMYAVVTRLCRTLDVFMGRTQVSSTPSHGGPTWGRPPSSPRRNQTAPVTSRTHVQVVRVLEPSEFPDDCLIRASRQSGLDSSHGWASDADTPRTMGIPRWPSSPSMEIPWTIQMDLFEFSVPSRPRPKCAPPRSASAQHPSPVVEIHPIITTTHHTEQIHTRTMTQHQENNINIKRKWTSSPCIPPSRSSAASQMNTQATPARAPSGPALLPRSRACWRL